jgi:uncharacterized protein YraI
LYIDNVVVIDAWDDHTPGLTIGQNVQLAGGVHRIQIDYREFSDTAFIYLDWGRAPQGTDDETAISIETIQPELFGDIVTISASALNIRAEPRIANNVITRVSRGQQFPLIGYSEDGNWVHVEVDNVVSGWVSSAYVTVNSINPINDNSDLSGLELRASARLFVRVAPSSDSEIIGLLRTGEVVSIMARNESITWWKIRDGSQIGWVSAQFVVLSPDVNPVQVVIAEA